MLLVASLLIDVIQQMITNQTKRKFTPDPSPMTPIESILTESIRKYPSILITLLRSSNSSRLIFPIVVFFFPTCFDFTRFLLPRIDVHSTTNGSQMTRDRTMRATISSDPPFCPSRDLFSPPSFPLGRWRWKGEPRDNVNKIRLSTKIDCLSVFKRNRFVFFHSLSLLELLPVNLLISLF